MLHINDVVPWRYVQTTDHGLWSWETPAFLAVVCKYDGTYVWEVSAAGTIIGAGTANNFPDGESHVLEVIGKAYTSEPEYARYAKDAAAHYVLADGQRHNLASLAGQPVRITLHDGTALEGRLQVGEWALHLEQVDTDLDVQPEYITNIAPLR